MEWKIKVLSEGEYFIPWYFEPDQDIKICGEPMLRWDDDFIANHVADYSNMLLMDYTKNNVDYHGNIKVSTPYYKHGMDFLYAVGQIKSITKEGIIISTNTRTPCRCAYILKDLELNPNWEVYAYTIFKGEYILDKGNTFFRFDNKHFELDKIALKIMTEV